MTGNTGPSYLIPLLTREQLLENLLCPRRVLLGHARVPSIQKIEFDGDDVPFASGCERMVKISGELENRVQRSAMRCGGDCSHLQRIQPPGRPVSDHSENSAHIITQNHLHEERRVHQSRPIENLIVLGGSRDRISDRYGRKSRFLVDA